MDNKNCEFLSQLATLALQKISTLPVGCGTNAASTGWDQEVASSDLSVALAGTSDNAGTDRLESGVVPGTADVPAVSALGMSSGEGGWVSLVGGGNVVLEGGGGGLEAVSVTAVVE